MGRFTTIEEAKAFFANDRFATRNGMTLDELDENHAVCSLVLDERHRNAQGGVMGGAIFTLADFAFAALTNDRDRSTVAQQVSVSYLAAPKGGRLVATARYRKDGRSSCVVNVDVADDAGRDVAQFVGTGFKLKTPPRSVKSSAANMLLGAAAVLFSAAAAAAAEVPAENAAAPALPAPAPAARLRVGGDLRLRQEGFDHVPIRTAEPAVTRGGHNDYFRIRPRLFAGIDFGEDVSLDARLCDEFRVRNAGQKSYEWPDELIVDQLKLTLRGLFWDRVDLTLGRQDVSLGSGRLFAEGTAKDGSRTSFFDGALARVRLAEKTTLDLFGFYGACENDLALGHEHRDLTGLAPGWNGMDEATAGFFLDDRSFDELGWGVYYVWLRDTAWRTRDGERVPHEDLHTLGARLLPRFSETLSADLEGALQRSGSDGFDRRAWFATGLLKWTFAPGAWAGLGALHLSGDDPATERREDFNVLFGRYPWPSELLLYGLDGDGVGTWHNLTQLWIEAGCAWGEGDSHKLRATAGPVFAPERDGAGGGRERGWLETVRYAFPLWREGGLSGHLFLEVFQPGDYYVSDRTAYFFRWELNWAF